jgi:hypothetical protein
MTALFNAATTVTLGNGEQAMFWTSRWLQGDLQQRYILPCSNIAKGKTERLRKH